MVRFYVLREGDFLYLVDTGFLGERKLLEEALRKRGWNKLPIAGIILTHGHLDHIFNAASLAADSAAWIAAPGWMKAIVRGGIPIAKRAVFAGSWKP